MKSHLFIPFAAAAVLGCATLLDGQNILNQFDEPYTLTPTVPFFDKSQFAMPGGLIFFLPADNSLKQLWNATLSLDSAQGMISGMAVAPDGVYLGGTVTGAPPSQVSAGFYDIVVFKYDLSGKSLWTQQFGTANGDYLRDIVVSSNGVYILGVNDGANRFFIRRSDTSGNQLWTRSFNDPILIDILGAAADTTGVYLVCMTAPATYNIVRKFDSSFIPNRMLGIRGRRREKLSRFWADSTSTAEQMVTIAVQ